jgi:nanoRNase/pAp phosphatase (c-di-AMP/oligoRNAs hydrolase)
MMGRNEKPPQRLNLLANLNLEYRNNSTMALIQISNLNSATSTATDSFLTELQATDTNEVFGGSGDKGYGEKKKNKGEEGGYGGGEGGHGGEYGGEGGYGGYGHYPAPIHYNPCPVYYPSHH